MSNRLINKVITKIKKEPYEIDEAITFGTIVGIIFERSMMLTRGIFRKIFFKKSTHRRFPTFPECTVPAFRSGLPGP